MLYSNVPPETAPALNAAFMLLAENKAGRIKTDLGPEFFRVLAAAYVCKSLTKFEEVLRIPPRSGKVLLPLLASVLTQYLKDTPS